MTKIIQGGGDKNKKNEKIKMATKKSIKLGTSILDVYALTCLQNKPKNLHESISFRYHLYLLTL